MFKINSACQNFLLFALIKKKKWADRIAIVIKSYCLFLDEDERNETIILNICCSFHGITIVKGNISNLFYS